MIINHGTSEQFWGLKLKKKVNSKLNIKKNVQSVVYRLYK